MTEFREEWLQNAVTELRTLLADVEVEVPDVRVATGWPSKGGTSTKKRTRGQCWAGKASADGKPQVFISPMEDDVTQILATLAHELIHAWDQCQNGHKGPFARKAKEFGLIAPYTSATPGDDLLPLLEKVAGVLGEYPHSKITPGVQIKVQTTRMLKVQCSICEYTVRTTQKWIDVGLPLCPEGDEMEVEVK